MSLLHEKCDLLGAPTLIIDCMALVLTVENKLFIERYVCALSGNDSPLVSPHFLVVCALRSSHQPTHACSSGGFAQK
jgi:hypothetical protein